MVQTELMTIGLLFLFAIAGGLIAARFKQPIVLGLLIIGTLIGPSALNLVNDKEMIDLMIEFGAILFLFVIGLEFSLRKLMRIGLKAIIVTLFKVGIMFFFGFLATILMGFSVTTAAFIGVAMSFSSTVIIMNILKQKEMIKRSEVPILIAVLVIEDIFGVIALTFFSAMKTSGTSGIINGLQHLVLSLLTLIIIYVVASKFTEQIVNWVTKHAGEEIIIFISLGICAAFAYLGYILGLSPSAGAFLAGSIVSTFRESKKFESSIKPHSFMFTAFFFIAMGTMINFTSIKEYLFEIIILMIVIVAGLFIAIGLVTRIFANFSSDSSLFSTFAMLPPGVFSMLVAKEGMNFSVEMDLVTVISVIIFVLAITMSLSITYVQKFTELPIRRKQGYMQKITDKFSNYIKSIFEEIEVENGTTRSLKRKAGRMTLLITGFILVLVLIPKAIDILPHSSIIKYSTIAVGILILAFIGRGIQVIAKEVFLQLVKVITNLEGGERIRKTKKILLRTIIGLISIILGLFSPLILYSLNAPKTYILLSIGVIAAGLFMIKRAYALLKDVSYEYKYNIQTCKKLDLSMLKPKPQPKNDTYKF